MCLKPGLESPVPKGEGLLEFRLHACEFLASAFRLLKRLQIMFLAKEALTSYNQATSSF